jgi:hypothetical protein
VHTEQGVNKRIKDSWGHPELLPIRWLAAMKIWNRSYISTNLLKSSDL